MEYSKDIAKLFREVLGLSDAHKSTSHYLDIPDADEIREING